MPPVPEPEFTKQSIAEFIAIWAKEFDEILTEEQARIEARLLLKLFYDLAQALPDEKSPTDSRTE